MKIFINNTNFTQGQHQVAREVDNINISATTHTIGGVREAVLFLDNRQSAQRTAYRLGAPHTIVENNFTPNISNTQANPHLGFSYGYIRTHIRLMLLNLQFQQEYIDIRDRLIGPAPPPSPLIQNGYRIDILQNDNAIVTNINSPNTATQNAINAYQNATNRVIDSIVKFDSVL